ncbi:putative transmembrane protein [Gregarina niphandrodes]|uniref:Transmembrane protein n=1 Tax=Gregarina niphandrodes TaxID=110365 RepID=A0A023B2G2_GRENI|nr:putative transmembrane protein [Gregarina niphandrodes]EZG52250.1 putative transmembrane protein [Gregarina niphandrodes]|eukprot:XP_011131898.1 putative transmembrane protein [Gregarina niphandrodes]
MADGIADEGDMACRGSFREAVLEFNKLHSMKEELNDELCRMVLDARAFYSLETDAYITPARVVLPPFTKGNLLRTIQNAFGDNYFEAVRLLIKYETVYQKMVLYRLLYRLIGIYPILPFTIRNTLRTILPTISLIWLSYLPKVILSMVMALSCIDTYDHLLGRQIYSAHCGYDAPKKMKKIVLQTFVGILGVIYILSIPIVITWTYDWHEITQFSRLSKGGRQARKGLEQRSRTSIRPGAIKLNIAATNKIATNKIATGSNIDDKLLSSNGPIRANLGRQTLSYQANIEDRILGGHFTTTIRPLAEIMLMGYKPSTWTILIAARFMIQGFVIIAPLSSNRLLFNIRLALMIKSLICLILIIKRPHTLRTFYGISICDLYGEFMMLGSIMFYEKINQTDDNVVFDFSTINSTKYQRWFITFIWLSIIGQLIIYLLITIYEYGKLISYTDYRWRSKLHKSGYNIPQNWFKKIYPKLSFQFFFKIAQILETRLIYNPTNKNLILKQFKPAGEDLPTSTNPLGKNDGYTLSLINHGLKALCSGRYSCMLHADTVSLLSRYCFEFIRKMREIYSETPSTLKELLKGLELMDMNKYHQDYIVELWLSGKDLISINNNNNGTINNNAGGTINNNNGTINNIFCDYYLSPLGTVRQFDISISETRWLRLITKRHAIRFASDCIDPSSFSYIEVLSTEFAMAIEHLVKLTPYMSSDLMASFIGVSYDQLIKERDLEKLELNKDVLIKQINNKIKSNGRNEEMMIMEYFQKVTELERLQKNCQSMYDSCVNAQIHVLENLGQDTELKLKQAGVKDQLLQESTCLRNVQTELETSRKPIDIFSYVLDDELTDDDDDEDLRMLKRRSTELNRVQVLPDDDDDQGQLMAGAAFDPTGIDPTGLYGIPDDDTSMIKPEYLKSEYLKSSSSSLDRPIGRRGGPREAYEKDHEIYSSSNSSDNEPYVLNPPAIGTEATVNDVFKATGTPQVVVMDLDQRKGKNHHTRSTFPEQEPPPAAADPAAGPTGDEPNLGWLQYVPEERLEEVIEHTLDDYEQPFTARDDNDDLESRRKYDVWEPN